MKSSEMASQLDLPKVRVGWIIAAILGTLSLFAWLTWLAVVGAHPDAKRDRTAYNMKQIGLALHHYRDTHGTFPPVYIPDEEGKPMHSWRVLILRELERKDLHALYDFDLPWDHPTNLEVASQLPSVFASPYFSEHADDGLTTYLAASAMGTIGGDAADRRILVIEVFDKPVPWTQPVDISPDEILETLKQMKDNGERGFHVLLADGSIRRIDPEQLREERVYIVDDELFLRGAK